MYSKLLKAAVAATIAAAPMVTLADSAPGDLKGDWIVRAGMHVVNPKGENLQPVLDETPYVSTLVVDDAASFTFDVTYMFSSHFGVELLAAYPFTHGIDAKPYSGGKIRAGYTDHLPPTLSLVYYPLNNLASVYRRGCQLDDLL